MNIKQKAQNIYTVLKKSYPDAKIALKYNSALELLVATILSAQCTDEQVNKVTPALFKKYKNPADYANANQKTLESMIRSTGFFKNKSASLKKCCSKLMEDHNGKIPKTIEELTKLPGVGRKTANVILGNYYKIPGIVVDTHVIRLSQRLGLSKNKNADKIELDLQPLFSTKDWTHLSHLLQAHGRRCCTAKKPKCDQCPVASLCPSRGKV